MYINLLKNKALQAFLLFITTLTAFTQNAAQSGQKKSNSSLFDKYDRASLTYCLLDMPSERYMDKIKSSFAKVKINDKYNDHSINHPFILKTPYDRYYAGNDKPEIIRKALNDKKTGNTIIAKWFSQKPDGSFSMDLIAERGVYNATDADVIRAKAGKRGASALQDAGEALIKKSYLVVFDYMNVETWDDYYDRQDVKNAENARITKTKPQRVYRAYSGYRGSTIAYLYKVDWNDSLAAVFYEKAWNDPDLFDKMRFPLIYVNHAYADGITGDEPSTQHLHSNDELMTMLEHNGSERILFEFAREYDIFRVKTLVHSVRPITAKIGTKEDVSIDQRFFVYEIGLDTKGNQITRRKGVIRASKDITDNRITSSGETKPTRFYQEAGKRIYPGMTMEQMYDYGASVSLGWAERTLQGPLLRLDINLARIVNWSLFRFYIEGQAGFGSVKFGNSSTSHNITSYNLAAGFSKEFILLKNIHFEPHIGVQWDSTFAKFSSNEKDSLAHNNLKIGKSTIGLIVGLRMPINILYNLQLVPAISVSTIMFSTPSMFGKELPSGFPSSIGGGKDNPNANLNKYTLKWEVTLRYKF